MVTKARRKLKCLFKICLLPRKKHIYEYKFVKAQQTWKTKLLIWHAVHFAICYLLLLCLLSVCLDIFNTHLFSHTF